MREVSERNIKFLMRLPLRELRRRQDIVRQQQGEAYRTRNTRALEELEVREKELDDAVGRKTFGNGRSMMRHNAVSGPVDTHAATELELFIENDEPLYRQQHVPIMKNLVTKMARGIFDREKAVTLFMYLVDNGARKYIQQFGTPGQRIDVMFNRNTRLRVARSLRDSFLAEAELGNYDHLLPKKYQRRNPLLLTNRARNPLTEREKRALRRRAGKFESYSRVFVEGPTRKFSEGRAAEARHIASLSDIRNPNPLMLTNRARERSRGRFIRERVAPPGKFDPRSFRTIKRGGKEIVIGCPKGHWSPTHQECKVGTRAQSILHPMKKKYIGKKNPGKWQEWTTVAYLPMAKKIAARVHREGHEVKIASRPGGVFGRKSKVHTVLYRNPGYTIGRGRTERKLTAAQAKRMMKKNARKKRKKNPILQTVGLIGNPPQKPPWKNGQMVPIKQAQMWVNKHGSPQLKREFAKAMKLQSKANRPAKFVKWRLMNLDGKKGLNGMTALVHYGKTDETLYQAPKGSKKGKYLYSHKWGEGKKGGKPVDILVTADGKTMVTPLGKGQRATDWMRG